jgi:hypothetical protein
LFGDLKPARTLQIDDDAFVTELTAAFHAYLSMGYTRRNTPAKT